MTAENSDFLFGDVINNSQEIIKRYYTEGRHIGIDPIQSYDHVPKHFIRDQCNILVSFKMEELNLRKIYKDHISDMSWGTISRIVP